MNQKITVMPSSDQVRSRGEWRRLISDFEASMHARGLSLRTVDHYSDTLNRVLVGFCEREGIGPKDLTKRHLERLAAELLAGGRARQSVKTYLTAINTFLTWCHAEEGMAELQAPRPSVPRSILDVLTGKEIEAMEDAATTERDK